jgi:hypothetical protein
LLKRQTSGGKQVAQFSNAGSPDRPLDRFTSAFIDPQRRDTTVIVALAFYLLVWTLYSIIAKSNQDLHPDMTELIAWSREIALGYPKHPPVAAMIVRGWFALFPVADWSFYLLAIATPTLALWVAWRQFEDYLNPAQSLVGLALLSFIPFYNFHALKFNVNTVLIPLWATTTYWFLRSYRTKNASFAALAGAAAGFCMLGKYWSIFLLAGLAIAAVSNRRRGAYFRSAAPWITTATGLAVVSPHLGWLERHHFASLQYAMDVHGGRGLFDTLHGDFRYIVDSVAYVIIPVAVVLFILRASPRTWKQMIWPADPELRLVAVALWATFLLPMLAALFWGVEIHGIWTMSGWTLLPILVLAPLKSNLSAVSLRRIAATALAYPLVMLAASPAVAIYFHVRGIDPERAHARQLAAQAEAAWHQVSQKPVPFVGGGMANGVLTYIAGEPLPLPEAPVPRARRIKDSGVLLVCDGEDQSCIDESSAIANQIADSRRTDTTVTHSYLGIAGQPHRYTIFAVPPTLAAPPSD